MTSYQHLQHKAQGLAFILAPLLMVIGSAAFVLGIDVTPLGEWMPRQISIPCRCLPLVGQS